MRIAPRGSDPRADDFGDRRFVFEAGKTDPIRVGDFWPVG
jgi:hypothetical protein